MASANQKVTLSINSKKYKEFRTICRDHDIMVSKRIERLIEEETKALKRIKRGKR